MKCYRCSSWPCECRDGITLIHGDCREILPLLPKVDLVLTDPPYGIADKWVGGFGRGWGKADSKKDVRNNWDAAAPQKELIDEMVAKGQASIVWGGNYFPLPPSRCWLIWNKPERGFSLAEAELAWSNADNVVRVCDCPRHCEDKIHPTQKPVRLMKWCLSLPWAKSAQTVLDPFCGSGTTLIAAKELGKSAIGIEINESYCELIQSRLRQEVLQFTE